MPSWDSLLGPLLESGEAERDAEIARLIDTVARPVVDGVLQRYARSGDVVGTEDAEDLAATIQMRLVTRLRLAAASRGDPIERFPDYVATLAFNAVNDHFRRSYPERTHVRNRIRYALSRDRRLALWTIREQLAGGLAAWRGSESARGDAVELPDPIVVLARDRDHPAEALVALFQHERTPFLVRALVETFLPLWRRSGPAAIAAAAVPTHDVAGTLEWREILGEVWKEVRELRPMQRKALLLNLRDADTSHVLDLLVVTGTATLDDIARVLEMPRGELASLWTELPLDDLRIASMLGLSRQQVISLRKSARERLARRIPYRRPS